MLIRPAFLCSCICQEKVDTKKPIVLEAQFGLVLNWAFIAQSGRRPPVIEVIDILIDKAMRMMRNYRFFVENDMSLPENYREAEKRIDIDSFVDYYAAEIYIGNQDWPYHNIRLWRSRSAQGGSPYQDGRWRAMLFDFNSYCFSIREVDMINWARTQDPMFDALCDNPEFVAKFVERLRYIADELCAPETYDPILSEYLSTMSELLAADNMRFYGTENRENRLQAVEDARTFFETRGEYVEKWIADNFPDHAQYDAAS